MTDTRTAVDPWREAEIGWALGEWRSLIHEASVVGASQGVLPASLRKRADALFDQVAALASPAVPPQGLTYEDRVQAMADALHEDCRLEWQAIAVVDPTRMVTQHMADAHYGQAHDLVRRLSDSGDSV